MILVVNDEPLARLNICSALEARGYRTIDPGDGKDALRDFREISPALMITDIYMPSLDGLALIMQLRRDGVRTPIIAISGDLTKYNVLEVARKLGADVTMEKPFSMQEIVNAED